MLHPTINRVALILSSSHFCTHLKFQDPNSAKKNGNAGLYPILNCSNPQNIQQLVIIYSEMQIYPVKTLYCVVLLIFPLSWDQEANRVLCKITEVKCKSGGEHKPTQPLGLKPTGSKVETGSAASLLTQQVATLGDHAHCSNSRGQL